MSEAGDATFNSNIFLGDNKKANFGDSNDLQIFHNANNSVILDNGTGSLSLQSNGTYVGLYDAANTNHMLLANVGADVQLYHNGSQKLATTASGVDVTGTAVTDGLTVAGNVSVDGGTIKLDGNYPVGTNNVALGNGALEDNVTGGANTSIGNQAGRDVTSSNNTAIGGRALYNAVSGDENTCVGSSTLFHTTGSNNTSIGFTAGSNLTSGNNCTFIGNQAQPSSATVSNEITLGNSSVTSLRIPGLQSGASSGDVLTYDGTDITLSAPTGVSAGFAVAMAIAL